MMSRWNDPSYYRHFGSHNQGLTPWSSNLGAGLLDTFFNDVDFTPRIRDHAGQLQIKDNGDFEYRVDVSGFRPEEIQVNLEGDEFLIQASHDERHTGEAVHREFTRRVRIPDGIQKETIRCDIDTRGRLHVQGHTQMLEGAQRRPIPIGRRREQEQIGQGTSAAGQGIIEGQRGTEQGVGGAGGHGGNIGGNIGERSAKQQ
jgi:HSP20 family molecular chaperone IbpA